MNNKKYKVINGTSYSENTPDEVVKWLETSRERRQRIRIFYGDPKSGKDWCEEYNTTGYIGRSTGKNSVPLMICSRRSLGGRAITDYCIVRITTKSSSGKIVDVYRHKNYHLYKKQMEIRKDTSYVMPFAVIIDGRIMAGFETYEKAEKYCAFLLGNRNRI